MNHTTNNLTGCSTHFWVFIVLRRNYWHARILSCSMKLKFIFYLDTLYIIILQTINWQLICFMLIKLYIVPPHNIWRKCMFCHILPWDNLLKTNILLFNRLQIFNVIIGFDFFTIKLMWIESKNTYRMFFS